METQEEHNERKKRLAEAHGAEVYVVRNDKGEVANLSIKNGIYQQDAEEENKMGEADVEDKAGMFGEDEQAEDYTGGNVPNKAEDSEDTGFGGPAKTKNKTLDDELDEDLDEEDEEEDTVTESEVEEEAEERIAEQKVQEFYALWMEHKGNDKKSKKTVDGLVAQWRVADELGLVARQGVDLTSLEKEKQVEIIKKVHRKVAMYNFIRDRIGIDPYRISNWRFCKKLRRTKSQLEKHLEIFNKQLRGAHYQNENAHIYAEVLERLPQEVKINPKYSLLMQYASRRSSKNSDDGLKYERRTLKERARFLSDMDDVLEATVISYNSKIDGVNKAIKDLTDMITANPQSKQAKKAMRKRTKKIALLSHYNREKDSYSDTRDDVLEELRGISYELKYVDRAVSLKEMAVMRTRKALTRLNSAIRHYEGQYADRADMVRVGEHLINVNQAYELAAQAEMAALLGDDISKQQYEQFFKEQDQNQVDPAYKNDAGLTKLLEEMKTADRERIAEFKKQVRNDLF